MAATPSIRNAGVAPAPLAAAGALAIGVAAESVALDGGVWGPWLIALDASVGVASVLAGLAAWLARPGSWTGPALVAIGGLWFLGAFAYGNNDDLIDFVGFPLQGWHDVLLLVLLLAVTPGGLHDRTAAAIAAGGIAAHAAVALARLFLRPPLDVTSCLCVPNRITGVTDPGPYETVVRVASLAEAGFALAALVLLALRWGRASGPARRTLAPLVLAGAATGALITYNRVVTRVISSPVEPSHGMLVLMAAMRISVALAIAVSLVRGHRSRTRVADVVISLDDRGLDRGSAAMRRALADPSLRLLRWSPERGCHVDAEGREVPLPGPGDPLVATVLERDGTLLGALVYDAALREEPELLTAVAAAARLALHNERLADEVRARLDDVRASRERIVTAGDAERRRLERDLHDGAQQQLVALALRLRLLERRAGSAGNVALADELDGLATELDATMATIRELARGIRPPVLSEDGLGAALEALAHRFPLPVATDVGLDGRLPEVVESTAYFVASEALANVLKYAGAERVELTAAARGGRLIVCVSDDGRGGANAAEGTGLLGLADRVDALGGSLSIVSPEGGGTTITADIPTAGAQAAG